MKLNLEELIHDMAERGELTHISLSPYEKQWAVSFCAASPVGGFTFILDDDPVMAMCRAITETKLKTRRRPTRQEGDDDTRRQDKTQAEKAPEAGIS